MAGHRLKRGPCPRCGRDCAINPLELVPVRHKDDGQWCSGEPKSIYELVSDLLDSTAAQREVLSGVVDAYIEFGERLLRASEEHTSKQATTGVLVRQLTAALVEQAEQLKAKWS